MRMKCKASNAFNLFIVDCSFLYLCLPCPMGSGVSEDDKLEPQEQSLKLHSTTFKNILDNFIKVVLKVKYLPSG